MPQFDNDEELKSAETGLERDDTLHEESVPNDMQTELSKKEKQLDDIAGYYEDIEPVFDGEASDEVLSDTAYSADGKNVADTKNSADTSGSDARPASDCAGTDIPKKETYHTLLFLCIAAVLFVIFCFLFARLSMPVSSDSIEAYCDRLKENDSAYLAAKTENSTLKSTISSLEEDSDADSAAFDTVIEYQKKYDSLKSQYSEQSEKLSSLSAQLNELQTQYEELNENLAELKSETYTLTPGIYTAGTNIPSGNYSVTGSSNLLVTSKSNSVRINASLSDNPKDCTLSDGDTIKLSASAVFIPKEN